MLRTSLVIPLRRMFLTATLLCFELRKYHRFAAPRAKHKEKGRGKVSPHIGRCAVRHTRRDARRQIASFAGIVHKTVKATCLLNKAFNQLAPRLGLGQVASTGMIRGEFSFWLASATLSSERPWMPTVAPRSSR